VVLCWNRCRKNTKEEPADPAVKMEEELF